MKKEKSGKLFEAANELMQGAAKIGMKVDENKLTTIIETHAAAAAVDGMHCKISFLTANMDAFSAMDIGNPQIVAMYVHIGKYLRIEIEEHLWTVMVATVVNRLDLRLLGHVAECQLPGRGAVTCGLMNYEKAYTAGVICLKALTGIFHEGEELEKMTKKQMKEQFKDVVKSVNIKEVFSEAKSIFKQMKEDGSLDEQAKGVDISEDAIQDDDASEE